VRGRSRARLLLLARRCTWWHLFDAPCYLSSRNAVGTQRAYVIVSMLHHCWHDVNVKFPRSGDPIKTVDSPTPEGRVCCYCGEIRTEPLPPLPPKRSHGPYVDDDSEWYVVDDAECRGQANVHVNLEPAVVPIKTEL
jgi:hypothetical protein